MKNSSSSIKQIIQDAKKGKMFILVDNKDRENEGDLVVPASKINHEKLILWQAWQRINMFSPYISKVKKLKLPLMSLINKSRTQTAFTVSIESKKVSQQGSLLLIGRKLLKLQLNHPLRIKILSLLAMYFH